jgi:hypothetical protein
MTRVGDHWYRSIGKLGGDHKMIEGYLQQKANGRYAINGAEFTSGDVVKVRIGQQWLVMRFEHDGEYYLLGEGISFYPKKIYVRYE